MSVKRDSSGRRSVQVEVEVPGTPEDVWQAIATGPGLTAWFVPAAFEPQGGPPETLTLDFGGGMTSTATVTAWQPPQRWGADSAGWVPGSPPISNLWAVEPMPGTATPMCTVRITHSLVADTDAWDGQLLGTEAGWPAFLRTLRLYLTHFRGQQPALMKWMLPAPGTEAEAWAALGSALGGLAGLQPGQAWAASGSAPALAGVVESVGGAPPFDALLRLHQPGPGLAALSAVDFGGQSLVSLSVTLYGAQALHTVGEQMPLWDAWFQRHFPSEPSFPQDPHET